MSLGALLGGCECGASSGGHGEAKSMAESGAHRWDSSGEAGREGWSGIGEGRVGGRFSRDSWYRVCTRLIALSNFCGPNLPCR